MNSKLIVALDFNDQTNALTLVDALDPASCALKVGSELFTLLGMPFVTLLMARGFKVFLDLKFHDIPNTVAKACVVAADAGVWMMNVHALGGIAMLEAAKKALESYGKDAPVLIAVTLLTSFNADDLIALGINRTLTEEVLHLATNAHNAGLDGVVCSAWEVKQLKQQCGADFLTVTPGIRAEGNALHDQSRIMTPAQAVQEGSDFLVVGRPITQAANPAEAVTKILQQISKIT